ncbi:MAG: hypothetical protein IPK20_13410 [Betaproteobacteria bacterium]|nr:hypothetical protein [Betaproteobacteria bacterium]
MSALHRNSTGARPPYALSGAGALVLIAACAAIAAGCSSPSKPKLVVECTGSPKDPAADGPALVGQGYGRESSPIPLNAVVFTGKDIAKRVAVQGLYAARTDAGPVEVGVRLINCTRDTVNVAVRTSFMDERQRPTEKPTAWKNVLVPPGSTGNYSALSIGDESVKYYLVEVRDGTL